MKFLIPAFLVLMVSCNADKDCAFIPDTSSIKLELKVESLEDSLPAIKTKTDLVGFMTRHPASRDLFFNRSAYPGDSTFINRLYNRFTSPHIDTLLMETHRVFGNGDALATEFKNAYTNLKYYYPEFQTR